MMKKRVLKTLVILVSLLLFVTGCHTDLDVQLFAKIAKVEDGSGIHYFPTLQKAIDYIVENSGSRDVSRDVSGEIAKERTAVLLKDVKKDAGSLSVYAYNTRLCIDLNGHEYFYSDGADSFLNVLDNSDVRVKNGKLIISEKNQSVRPVFIIGTQDTQTSVRLTDLVVDDRRNCGNVDEFNEMHYQKAVQIMGKSTLVIDGESKMGNDFSADSDTKIEINSGTIDIFRLDEPNGPCSFSITGGTIHHTHGVDERVEEAARGHESSIVENFVHVVSDFSYTGSDDTVIQHCRYSDKCEFSDVGAIIKTYAPVYNFKNAPYDDVSYIEYDEKWAGMRPNPTYETNYNISTNGNNKDVGIARVWAEFYDYGDKSQDMTKIATTFVIGDKSGGYAGFEIIPPEYVAGADGSVVRGNVTIDEATGVVSFVKDDDIEITGWSWVVDGVVKKSSSDAGVDPADPNSGDPISVYSTGEVSSDRTFVCYVSSLGGQVGYGLKMIVPRGEIVYDSVGVNRKLSFNHYNKGSSVSISNYVWTINGADHESEVLDLTGLSLTTGTDYAVSLKCKFLDGNSYRTFTLSQPIHYEVPVTP